MTEVATASAAATGIAMAIEKAAKELSPEEERVLIRDIALTAEANTKEGDSFFLITQKLISFCFFSLEFLLMTSF